MLFNHEVDVRGIPYPSPDHCNYRKSYCRRKAGRRQGSQPPRLGLAVTIDSAEFPAVRQANLDRPNPRTTRAAMGGLRPTRGSPEQVYNNSPAHVLEAIGEPTF